MWETAKNIFAIIGVISVAIPIILIVVLLFLPIREPKLKDKYWE